jgi:cellulose synthase/poly-beta-1,6-N-acetylglucosamine synthase-like glycosyltransferase
MLSPYQRYRVYEALPALSIWLTFIGGFVLSFVAPIAMMYVVIIFDVYWVLRVVYFALYTVLSWLRFRRALRVSWFKKLQAEVPNWKEKINVIFLPVYNEEWDVVRATFMALCASTYPVKNIYVVMAGEARKAEHWEKIQRQAKAEFGSTFADLIFYTHPTGLPDEIAGKGSNIHHAEHEFKKYADSKGWDYRNIILSVFDVDTIVHPEYFAHLTFVYAKHPHPERSSFQPVTLYNNNIWESPAPLRIMAFGTTFWTLFSLARLDNLVTFSSHSMSFAASVKCGGHAKNIVSEDSRIFFQCWLANEGNYEVTPLYIPVSMHTVRDDHWWKSFKNLYFQQRRWAWGSEQIPYLLNEFPKHPKIPWHKKLLVLFHEWEGKWSWGVVPIFVTFYGRLPMWFSGEMVRRSALFFNTPFVLQFLMTLAMFGLFVSIVLSMLLLPPRPKTEARFQYFYMLAQWALVPVSLIFFSAIPCIDAVTHLMIGRYLGFNVSAKKQAAG